MFDPAWWRFIAGQEHRWARAPNSSQCFAVNLFAPAAERPNLAYCLLAAATGETLFEDAAVNVTFEHTPEGAPKWLGESRQPTQVDVFFAVTEAEETIGHLLVEVKLTEPEFGSCRGPKGLDKNGKGNPHPERCRRGATIAARHGELCWLSSSEGRQYWNIIAQCPGKFDFTYLGDGEPCPFADGLYQLLRNHALSRALVS
ncbi:MAG: hypothetical protein OEM59_05225 [Rhodospirillales bacterium]|nr:hypothetical protein [Rhodospirillales bacterium]